jgi:NADH-quinone oxidoreductase subunit C
MLVDQIKEHLEKHQAADFDSLSIAHGDLVGYAKKDSFIELCRYLKKDPDLQFNFLSMITAADYLDTRDKRFEIVYSLFSITQHHRIMLKIKVDDKEPVPSLTEIWDTANWQEREVYDMFGIEFAGHPKLTRVLMDDDWVGYPQRKDFPLTYEVPEFSHNRDKITLDDKTPGQELP